MARKRVITGELEVAVLQLFAKPEATTASVARATGLCQHTVGRWRRRRERATDPELLRARQERAELLALRRRVQVLEEEREILAKAAAFLDREIGRAVIAFGFVDREKAQCVVPVPVAKSVPSAHHTSI